MEKRIKVLHIAGCPEDLTNIKGGVESVIVNLLEGFSVLPVEVDNISIRDDIKTNSIGKIGSNIRLHYLKYSVNKKVRIMEFALFGRKKLLKLINQLNPDIIHLQGSGPRLLYLFGMDKNKVVITQHAILSQELKYQVGLVNKVKFFYKVIFEKLLLNRYKNYVFISNYNKREFEKNNKNHTQVASELISNPVKKDFFKVGDNNSNNSLLYVGVINKRKGLDILLKALAKLKAEGCNYKLHVVGGTKEQEYYEEVVNYCNINGLKDQVIFHGWASQKEIIELYKGSSMFILPSRQETLPVSIMEAMAAGKVVVASDVGGVKEMFDDEKSGFLFEKDNVENLYRVLKDLYSNHSLVMDVSKNAREVAIERYHPENVAVKTLNFYKRIVANTTPKN